MAFQVFRPHDPQIQMRLPPGKVISEPNLPTPSIRTGVIQSCWAHKATKRPSMSEVVSELLQVLFTFLSQFMHVHVLGRLQPSL